MAFEVPDLPYDYNALEPHIDEETMKVHHDRLACERAYDAAVILGQLELVQPEPPLQHG